MKINSNKALGSLARYGFFLSVLSARHRIMPSYVFVQIILIVIFKLKVDAGNLGFKQIYSKPGNSSLNAGK